MASQPQKPAPRLAPRLYLATPEIADPREFANTLSLALADADVAAVLLRLAPADERTLINRVKALAPAIQASGAAVLLEGHAEIVAHGGADGAHLPNMEELQLAGPRLKPDNRIVGAGGMHTRHDAMIAAEDGSDYIMFGEPDEAGERPSFDAILERIEWWSGVFEIPCVAWAGSSAEVGELAAAGADFIAIGEWAFTDPRGVAAVLEDATTQLSAGAAA
jgi:thiamine-phosphate pyrophosphorylase